MQKKQLSGITALVSSFLITTLLLLSCVSPCLAKERVPEAVQSVSLEDEGPRYIDLDSQIVNSSGESLSVQTLFDEDKVVLLNFVYFSCPNLCHFLLDGTSEVLNKLDPKIKSDIKVVSLSFHFLDTSAQAAAFQKKYQERSPGVDWEFYTADKETIQRISDSVGFKYNYDPSTQDYAHAPLLLALSSNGQASRYLQDIRFDPFDLKLAIIEAKNKEYRSPMEQGLLFCYNYDPNSKGYVIEAKKLMKVIGAATLLFLLLWMVLLSRKARKK